ncbi:hypothetical protein WH47_02244 [Habropoda laboriosa]|uniref:Uncharacterized protein n=1 Tax=Habropoda laboriosa TaxID=597456 RepID=A0A0L7QZV1_9HYME|nr:hypothetical protein WH47_02244 [Habropoda laboriosa]
MSTLQVTVASTSTPTTNTVQPSVNDMDWFAGVAEEELLYYTGVGNDVDSLWAVIGSFVPPPPRPPYLPEEGVTTDGLTTCDLCSWAWRNDRHSFSLDGTLEAPGELGWVLTLVIVSLVSAGIGAVVMVTLLHCRRLKSTGGRASCCSVGVEDSNAQEAGGPGGGGGAGGGVAVIPDRPPLELDKLPPYHDVAPSPEPRFLWFHGDLIQGHNVWSWLGSRRGGGTPGVVTTPLSLPQHRRAMNLPVENHYTHMQTDEALYAELDSQAASYASDLQLQMRGSSTYGTTSGGQDDEYHELDAARLHRHYGGSNGDGSLQRDTLRTRHSKREALLNPNYFLGLGNPLAIRVILSSVGTNGTSYPSGKLSQVPRETFFHFSLDKRMRLIAGHQRPYAADFCYLIKHKFVEREIDHSATALGDLEHQHSLSLQEPDYEMYENGPSTPVPPGQMQHHHHHHHHHNHHHHHQDLRIGSRNGDHPSYQNTAYTGSDAEPDGPTLSSAPSSAYYSDLSSNSANQQMPAAASSGNNTNIHLNPQGLETPQYRLAAINESSVPSDYI